MLKAGVVGFLPDDRSKTEETWKLLEKYAEIGYRAMDMDLDYAIPGGDLKEKYERVCSLGIKPIMSGASPEVFQDPAAKIKSLHIQEINQVCMYSSSMIASFRRGYGSNAGYDEVMQDFEFMNKAVLFFESEGIHFCYHNHYQEFTTCYNGISGFDLMLLHVDPRLKFNIDLGWAMVAGLDPVKLLKRLEGRIANVHLKDFYDLEAPKHILNSDPSTKVGFTSLGSGLLPVDPILKEMDRQGLSYACVEQDVLRHLDRVQTLTASYLRMKESGYVK